MNRAERERLIERYTCGEMSAAEESDFFIQVALDKELRQELKAQRVIESALRKDLESESTEHTAMRSRVAAMLTATPAGVPVTGTSAAGGSARPMAPMAAPVAAARPRPTQRKRWLMAPLQWVAASALALALTVGTVIVLPSGGGSDMRPTEQQIDNPKVQHNSGGRSDMKIQAPVMVPPATPAQPSPDAVEKSSETRPASPAPVRSESMQRAGGRENAVRESRTARESAQARVRPSGSHEASGTDKPAARENTPTTVQSEGGTSDEPLKVGVTVQIPKKTQQP